MRTKLNLRVAGVLAILVGTCVYASASLAETLTFQQGVSGYNGATDIHLRQDDALSGHDHNTGREVYLVVGQYTDNNDNDNCRTLVDFGNLGTTATYMQANNLTIASATLKLYLAGTAGISSSTSQTVDLFKAATAFHEGAGSSSGGRDGAQATSGESCFNFQSFSSTRWADGGSHSSADWSTALATGTTLTAATVSSWVDFDVTGAFAADGSDLNNQDGFVLLARVDNANPYQNNTQGGNQFLFASSQAGSISTRPTLEITLTTVPEPSSMAIVVTGLFGLLAYAWRKRK